MGFQWEKNMDTTTNGLSDLLNNLAGGAGLLGIVGAVIGIALLWWLFRFFFGN